MQEDAADAAELPGRADADGIEHCEFYIEPGYLHVRLPYWDYELKEPGFVRNGDDLWRGWLTMKIGDVERFLKVEKW